MYFVAKNFINLSFVSVLLLLILVNTQVITSSFIIGLCIVITSVIFFIGFTKDILQKIKVHNLGDVKSYELKPTPGKSMFNLLNKEGVKPSNIKELYIMTYELNNKYHKKSDYSEILNKHGKEYSFNIFGYGKEKDIEPFKKDFKHFKIRPLSKKYTEHFNLIKTTQNNTYLWYEPFHKSIGDKELLPEGAYLIEVSSQKYNDIKNNIIGLK